MNDTMYYNMSLLCHEMGMSKKCIYSSLKADGYLDKRCNIRKIRITKKFNLMNGELGLFIIRNNKILWTEYGRNWLDRKYHKRAAFDIFDI